MTECLGNSRIPLILQGTGRFTCSDSTWDHRSALIDSGGYLVGIGVNTSRNVTRGAWSELVICDRNVRFLPELPISGLVTSHEKVSPSGAGRTLGTPCRTWPERLHILVSAGSHCVNDRPSELRSSFGEQLDRGDHLLIGGIVEVTEPFLNQRHVNGPHVISSPQPSGRSRHRVCAKMRRAQPGTSTANDQMSNRTALVRELSHTAWPRPGTPLR